MRFFSGVCSRLARRRRTATPGTHVALAIFNASLCSKSIPYRKNSCASSCLNCFMVGHISVEALVNIRYATDPQPRLTLDRSHNLLWCPRLSARRPEIPLDLLQFACKTEYLGKNAYDQVEYNQPYAQMVQTQNSHEEESWPCPDER